MPWYWYLVMVVSPAVVWLCGYWSGYTDGKQCGEADGFLRCFAAWRASTDEISAKNAERTKARLRRYQ